MNETRLRAARRPLSPNLLWTWWYGLAARAAAWLEGNPDRGRGHQREWIREGVERAERIARGAMWIGEAPGAVEAERRDVGVCLKVATDHVVRLANVVSLAWSGGPPERHAPAETLDDLLDIGGPILAAWADWQGRDSTAVQEEFATWLLDRARDDAGAVWECDAREARERAGLPGSVDSLIA